MIRAAAIAALAIALLPACTARDTIAAGSDGGDDRPGFCATAGAATLVDGTCTGALAEEVFRHAVCGCAALSFAGDVVTDGFDSRIAPYAPGGLGGHLGSSVGVDAAGTLTVGGDLAVGGSDGIEAGPRLEVAGDLTCNGSLGRSSSDVTIEGAARIAGDVELASLLVGGTLTTTPDATLTGTITAGARQTAAITVPPPCRCDEAVDVAAIVADHALSNHDAAIGLTPDALIDPADPTLELPCGRFYLDEIRSAAAIVVRSTGRTVLVIGGNVTTQALTVELAPDAELDLIIAGTIQSTGPLLLGDPERPRALRIYLGSTGSLNLPTGSQIAANLHAPRTDLALTPPATDLHGAFVVAHVAGGGTLTIHHDRAIADAAATCP